MPALLPSERPEVGRAKYHWITMFSKPPTWIWVTMLLALVAAIIWPWPMIIPFAILFGFNAFRRWQYWDQALVVLTQRRIIRVIGVPEATTTEVSLRVDRIHGLVLQQTLLGKLLDYGTIELESPVKNNDLQELRRIERPHQFYRLLRTMVFGDGPPDDPDYRPEEHNTAPLPELSGQSKGLRARMPAVKAKLPDLKSKLTGRST